MIDSHATLTINITNETIKKQLKKEKKKHDKSHCNFAFTVFTGLELKSLPFFLALFSHVLHTKSTISAKYDLNALHYKFMLLNMKKITFTEVALIPAINSN